MQTDPDPMRTRWQPFSIAARVGMQEGSVHIGLHMRIGVMYSVNCRQRRSPAEVRMRRVGRIPAA
ncbi:MAG: hypothetical protein GDA49_06535 [Rhodospirillales bacterium]|nr:hypothetical protein [Rhodospirillales bacterium]